MALSLQDVGLAVKRLQWRHHREANRRLAPLGLTLAQWDVLRHLHNQPDASLHDLAGLTFQTDQSMGTLAGRMVDRGLLERRNGAGRAVKHALTATGEQLREQGSEAVTYVMASTLGRLSKSELAALYKLLRTAGAEDDF